MIKKWLTPAFVILTGLYACNNHDSTSNETVQDMPAPSSPDTSGQTAVPATAPGKFRLNPPHGQPGHTCDVPEGAPLSNAPATAGNLPAQILQAPAPQPINNASPAAVNSAPVTSTSTPAGMNPPHGQPGHRCDIAVGAPLNSQPASPQKVTKSQTLTPAVPATAAGMNPPHGQPGHRCDIAVGTPLNSKPAAAPAPVTGTPPPVTAYKKDSTIPLH